MYPVNIGSTPLEVTSLQPLGHVVRRTSNDGAGLWWDEMRVCNKTGGTLIASACYVIQFDGDEEFNPKIGTAAAVATVQRLMCVATEAALNGAYTWVVIRGYYPSRCDGTTDIAKGDFLKLAPGTDADAMIKDGTAETISSVGIAREAFTTDANGNVLVYLPGTLRVINT